MLQKLPSVYGPLLRKEGVTHEIGKLAAVLKKEIRRKSQSSSSVEDIKQVGSGLLFFFLRIGS